MKFKTILSITLFTFLFSCTPIESALVLKLNELDSQAPEKVHILEVDGKEYVLNRGATSIETNYESADFSYSSFTTKGVLRVFVHYSAVNNIQGSYPVISNNSYYNGLQVGKVYIEFDPGDGVNMYFSEYRGNVEISKEGDRRVITIDNLQMARYRYNWEDGTAIINGSAAAVMPHNPW